MTSATTKSTSLAPNYEYHTSTPQSLHTKCKMQVCTVHRDINILVCRSSLEPCPFLFPVERVGTLVRTARWRRQDKTHGLALDGKSHWLELAVASFGPPPFRFKDNKSLDFMLVHFHYFCVQWVKPCPDKFPEPRDSLLSTTDDTVVPTGKVYAICYGWQACTHERQWELQQ